MANGQQITSARGSVSKVLTVALVGLALATQVGTMLSSGADDSGQLTGQAMTTALESIVPSRTSALTGLESESFKGKLSAHGRSLLASFQGTTVANLTVALIGHGTSVNQGLIFANNNDGTVGPLVGVTMTGEQGLMISPGSFELIGSVGTSEAGTLNPLFRPTDIEGQVIPSGIGIITAFAQDVTINLSGVEFASSQGLLDAQVFLVGQGMTSAPGSISSLHDRLLAGLQTSMLQGPIQIGQDPDDTKILSLPGFISLTSRTVALVGSTVTSAAGIIGVTPDTFQPLTGTSFSRASGTLVANTTRSLLGSVLTSLQGNFGAPGQGILTGLLIVAEQGPIFTDNDRVRTVVGSACLLETGVIGVTAGGALIGLSDVMASGTMTPAGGNQQRALTGLALTTALGTMMPTGADVISGPGTNEGCEIISEVALEGCGIVSGTEVEERGTIYGWGDLPWGEEWGGKEVSQTVSGIAREVGSG